MAEVSLQQPISIEERIPESAKFGRLSSASVIRGRRTVRYVPSTGTTVDSDNGSQIITFRVSDSNAYLDPLSCYLTFDLALTQGDISLNGGVAWDDIVVSLFNRIKTEFNSVQMDDIVDVDSLTSALVYSMGDRNAYSQDLGIQAGSWKWNAENYGVAQQTNGDTSDGVSKVEYYSEGSAQGVQRRGSVWWQSNYSISGSPTTNQALKFKFGIPLSYFKIGILSQPKFVSLRNLGILTINLFTNSAGRALRTGVAFDAYNPDGTSPGAIGMGSGAGLNGAKFVMSNIAIVGQVLDMDPRFLEVVDRVSTTSESGLIYDFNTYTNLKSSYNSTTEVTERQVVVSKASTSLRNMYIVRQPSSWRQSAGRNSVTGFPNLGCEGFRVQINSLYIPEYGQAETPAQQFNLGRQAHALLGNQDSLGNTRVDGYTTARVTDTDINGQHVLVVGFDRSTNQYIALDGLNSTSSGGTITVTIKDAGRTETGESNTAITFNSWVEFTRYLCLKQNAVSVVG